MRHAWTMQGRRLAMTAIMGLSLSWVSTSVTARGEGGQGLPGANSVKPGGAAGDEPEQRGSSTQSEGNGQVSTPKAGDEVRSQSMKPVLPPDQPPGTTGKKRTEAERIAILQRLIKTNQDELNELKRKLAAKREDLDAQKAFETLDNDLEARKSALEEAQRKGETDKARQLAAEVAELQKPWQLAKERFDLDLRERKTIQERITILESTIKHDQNHLDELLGNKPKPKPQPEPAPTPEAKEQPEKPAKAPASQEEPAKPTAPAPVPAPSPAAGQPAVPPLPGLPGASAKKEEPAQGKSETAEPAQAKAKAKAKPPSKELIEAEETVKRKAEEASERERRSVSLDERLANVEHSIKLEQELLDTARLQERNARQSLDLFSRQVTEKAAKGAAPAALAQLRDQVRESSDRLQEALDEIKARESRLRELDEERDIIADARRRVAETAKTAKEELEKAQGQVKRLQNPLAPRNVARWLLDHGLAILAILAAMIVSQWAIGRLTQKVVNLVASRGMRGSKVERENRAKTLVSVFHNAATLAIFTGGGLMICEEAGVPVGPLLGGAAVFGLAVAFGAQNLIRDYFYGFMILLENQYKLNDVIQIGDHSGQVEQITLRMTAIRDEEGSLHFLPNGAITSVINKTHGWSRALFSVGIAYKEDVDRVMEVIVQLGKELRQDTAYRLLILEDLTMLGVDSLGDSAVILKFFIKTLPLQQWTVKREFLRRLKKRFDEQGIEIPFPSRTLILRADAGAVSDLV